MQEVNRLIDIAKNVWNVDLSHEHAKLIIDTHPDIFLKYNLQKELFGSNVFDGRGHKPTKKYETSNNSNTSI